MVIVLNFIIPQNNGYDETLLLPANSIVEAHNVVLNVNKQIPKQIMQLIWTRLYV